MHKESRRIVPGAKTAVLFIHGICGTPNHFRSVLPLEELVPPVYSVHNLILDGHGSGVMEFGHSSMEQWKRRAWQAFEDLAATHEKVILVGHSMGTLFSIQLAAQYPDKIPFVFLLGVPLRVWLRLFGIRNFIRFGFDRLDQTDPVQKALRLASGITPTKKLWRYLPWIPRMLELFDQMRRTEKLLSALAVPAFSFQSKYDELVSSCTGKILNECGKVQVVTLPKSTHFYYHPDDAQTVRKEFLDRCEEYR